MSAQLIIVGIVAVVVVVAILVFRDKGEVDVDLPGFKGRGAFERAPARGRTTMKDFEAGRSIRIRIDDAADGDIDLARMRAGDGVDIWRSHSVRSERPPVEP